MTKEATISKDDETLKELITGLIENDQGDRAQLILEEKVKASPTSAACFYLGQVYNHNGNVDKAFDMLNQAVELNPANDQAYAAISKIALEQGQVHIALEYIGDAIKANPQKIEYRELFIVLSGLFAVKTYNPQLQSMIEDCLHVEGLNIEPLWTIWHNLLKQHPDFKPIYKSALQKNYDGFKRVISRAKTHDILVSPYFLDGLKNLIAINPVFEFFLTNLRRLMLVQAEETEFLPADDMTKLACALSQYGFNTEYVFYVSPEEQDIIDSLLQKVENLSPEKLAVLACYVPLSRLQNRESVKSTLLKAEQPHFKDLVQVQINDIEEQEKIKETIESITKIEDAVSSSVQAQYEEFPYPRWRAYSKKGELEKNVEALKGKKANILIAGCGTGQEAIELALTLPDADILAVDLSRTSLAYAIFMSKKYKLKNITFTQGDILLLDASLKGKQFDMIASSGVLHHLESPEKGWKILTGLLKPDGIMRIALYSELARQSIVKARKIIKEKKYGTTDNEIRRFRHDAPSLLDKHTLDKVRDFRDYYFLSECRDLLFHVMEHRYDLAQIHETLERLQLNFIQFYQHEDIVAGYKKQYPDDPEATNLENWAKFEERNPVIFRGMYVFLCQKAS